MSMNSTELQSYVRLPSDGYASTDPEPRPQYSTAFTQPAPLPAATGAMYAGIHYPREAHGWTQTAPDTNWIPPQTKPHNGKAVASLVLGLCGTLAWILPLVGFPVTITGLVLGLIGMQSGRRGMAIAGVILCIVFLVFTTINSVVGALMGLSGAFNQPVF